MPSARSSVKDDLMKPACWGLAVARAQAQRLLAQPDRRRIARQLVAALSTSDPEQRVRAADVARRITEKETEFFAPHAAEIASTLAEMPINESRTRWHLGIVAARSARTPQQIRLAAEILWQLSEDKSNVVRCSAVEGLGLLARHDPLLRNTVEPFLHQALVTGTCAMRVRARKALCWLQSSHRKPTRNE
jgi:HEAT repeat protein